MNQFQIYWSSWYQLWPWHHHAEVNEEWGRYIQHYAGWSIFQFSWMEG